MYSERAHSGFDVMREIGMSSLNKLAQAVIDTHDQNRVDRETIHAEDVIRGRAIWRLTTAGWHSGFDFDIMVRPRQRRYPVGSAQEVFWHELPKRFQACVVMHVVQSATKEPQGNTSEIAYQEPLQAALIYNGCACADLTCSKRARGVVTFRAHSYSSIGDTSPSSTIIPFGKHLRQCDPQLTDRLLVNEMAEPKRQPQMVRRLSFGSCMAPGDSKWHFPLSLTFTTNRFMTLEPLMQCFQSFTEFNDETRARQHVIRSKCAADELRVQMRQS